MTVLLGSEGCAKFGAVGGLSGTGIPGLHPSPKPKARALRKNEARGPSPMGTFLPAIEKPDGFIKKLVYTMSKKQFGKVPTPVKVVYSRMPTAFGMFVGKISKLD